MLSGKKPIVAVYNETINKLSLKEGEFYMNGLYSNDNKYHSFRCPKCGLQVYIGKKKCGFCHQKLKWIYPFNILNVD